MTQISAEFELFRDQTVLESRVQNPPNFFRSGAVKRFSQKSVEQSGAVERKFQKNSIFLVFFMNFSRIIAQGGRKRSHITPDALARCLGTFLINLKCRTRYVSKNLRGAERSGGAEYQKICGAERSWSGPLRSNPAPPLHGF